MSARRVGLLLLAAQILSMLGFASYPALLPQLRDRWALSNSEAGLIGSSFFVGYVATVSYWTALTDRLDGRKIYLAGGLIAGAGLLGFALLARGLWSAMLCQALLGVGVAATYMPGLRLLSDHVGGVAQSRYIAFYTSFFGVGTALSLLLAGAVAPAYGWRAAFAISAAGPFAAALLVRSGLDKRARVVPAAGAFSLASLFPLGAWRRVLAQRAAAGYIAGYAAHCLELFGARGWIVAFLSFAAASHPAGGGFPWAPAAIAAFVNLCAVPASILGNEVALRIGRRPWILIAMLASGSCGILLGASVSWYWPLVILLVVGYSMLVMAESATLTAGLVAAAPDDLRGAAMGLYSLAGFGGGMIGPLAFGAALDLAGGEHAPGAWAWGYAAIGSGCLAAPLVARLFGRGPAA
ncbi:MAG TPA: MFS transporter [Burkholderiales bacterium]|nr:MFS transporter [Burkholderiales bacterium]